MSESNCRFLRLTTQLPQLFAASTDTSTHIHKLHIFKQVTDIPVDDWRLLSDTHSTLYFSLPYLSALEACKEADAEYRYVLVKRQQVPVLIAYCQIIPFDMGKTSRYTALPPQQSIWQRLKGASSSVIKRATSNLKVNLLVCGNLYLSGEYGYLAHPTLSETETYRLLTETLERVAQTEQISTSGILIKDFDLETHRQLSALEQYGYHPFQGDPIMRMKLPREWSCFEDYLQALSSKYRQRAKSALKKSQALVTRELDWDFVYQHKETMYGLFEQVVKKAHFNLKETPENYFCCLKHYLPQKVKVTGYFDGERLVGFMSIIRAGRQMEAHFLGYTDEDNHHYKLYQRMLYDMVHIGITEGFEEISFGRTAIEIKTTVGAVPHEANMYLRLRNPLFNRFASPVIRNIQKDPYVQRHPFKGQEQLEQQGVGAGE